MYPSLKKYKGIFLDLDDTLYEYAPCNTAGNAAVVTFLAERLGADQEKVLQSFTTARQQVKDNLLSAVGFETAAAHSRLLYGQRLIEHLTGQSQPALTTETADIFWSAYFKVMTLFPAAREFLELAKRRGKTLAIVTDLEHRVQLDKLLRLGIADLIDIVVSSEEAGRDKPHPAALLLALQKTGLQPDEVVYIGESEAKDVAGAQAAGITPILIHYPPTDDQTIAVAHFKALTALVLP